MRRDITVRGASFAGASDLTIVAPIKKGFVPALDAVTYKTRVQRVLKTLHVGRQTAHEYEFARVLSDAVERVGRIHSIRIAIIEPEDKVMLAVTFDGSWESYIRVIWQKVSRSLDLIFCNTEDYVTGWDHSFDEWCAWLRKSQAEAPFLYSPPGLTYQDTQYLRMHERRLRGIGDLNDPDDPAKADLAATRIQIPTAEAISDQLCKTGTDPTNLRLDEPLDDVTVGRPAFRQGMRGLAGLYRMADLHLPGTPDGNILHRAASELLREFVTMLDSPSKYQEAIAFAEERFLDALDWLRDTPPSERAIPALPDRPDRREYADVQGGIIHGYPDVSDGCLLLLAFDSTQDLGEFLTRVRPTTEMDDIGEGGIALNIALTLQGLRLAGLSDDDVAALPEEFAQGMERRAGMLGDVRVNHPRRWRLPPLNWAQGVNAADLEEEDPCPRVDLSGVHLVLQLRIRNTRKPTAAARALLLEKYASLVKYASPEEGIAAPRPLSIQWMHRLTENGEAREHFGFLDSQSEPVLNKSEAGEMFANQIHLGEILLGHDNAADAAPKPEERTKLQKLLRNGSFMVVRKLRQDVGALEEALAAAVKDTKPEDAPGDAQKEQRLLLLGKMVGRWPIGHRKAGKALANASPTNDNDFSFDFDTEGERCPFHAHIRRANPRETAKPLPPGARPARLIRRGMSYGPLHDAKATGESAKASLAQERGLVFMAYNASIGEQFEVVQRWLTGGNSSGSYSGQSDPLLGVAEPGRPRYMRFEDDNHCPVRIRLDGSNRMHDDPRPFVRLEWGMYLFTPSVPALETLAERAKDSCKVFAKSWSVDKGEEEIARLRDIEKIQGEGHAFDAWKAAIEDPNSAVDFTAASIWAAIRSNHGGVLETPFGVLVASRDLVDEVLNDRARNLTATGYLPRMHRSFGPLYLGMDAGQIDGTYELESVDVNIAIMNLVAKQDDLNGAIDEAARKTCEKLDALKRRAVEYATSGCEPHWEVTFEAREIIDEVLAHFCEKWFGLSQRGGYLKKSGMRWNWDADEPPCYPGHFMAPSRYTFQPHPGPDVERIGATHGLALRVAVTKYLQAFGADLTAPVARAAVDCDAARRDPTYAPRTLAGVLMGFLPTTDGNMRRVLNEWLNEGTLWELRAQYAAADPDDAAAQGALTGRLHKKFIGAMQLRAAPELLWRTAATGHVIGNTGPDQVAVRAGQVVIASLISATQECLENGDSSVTYAFGGDRRKGTHPTHACPGYGPAMAVMLGFFEGLVKSGLALRPGPAPLSFYMDGYEELPETCAPILAERVARPTWIKPQTFGSQGKVPLLPVGDSWLVNYIPGAKAWSLGTELARLNYWLGDIFTGQPFAATGQTLGKMAHPDKLFALGNYLANVKNTSKDPKAILIGGGGNDLVDPKRDPNAIAPPDDETLTALFGMLVKNATSAAAALNPKAVTAFIDDDETGLIRYYRAILTKVREKTSAPILIHAYDHPIPDGRPRPPPVGSGPWLKPVFDHKEINIHRPVSDGVMRILIDSLNAMVVKVALEFPEVYPLNLNGELEKQGDYAADHKKYWANELHGTKPGFAILANVIHKKLAALGVGATSLQAGPPS